MPHDPVEPRRRPGAWFRAAVGLSCALAACAGGDATGPSPDPGLSTPGLHLRTLEVQGTPRRYRVYLPPGVDPATPVPVVLVLHGFPPVDMAVVTGMNDEAERRGFLAVYPETAWGEEWVQGCDCTPNALRGVDDLVFFDALLADLAGAIAVDPARRFVAGFSNGGMMTYRLACDRAGTFAGFAAVGAAVWAWHRDHCGARTPAPLLMVHGTADPSFPWTGARIPLVTGEEAEQLALPDHLAFWAAGNGCDGTGVETPLADTHDDSTRVYRRDWVGCDAPTLFYRVEGGGHTWPGMRVTFGPALGPLSRDLDATAAIAEFFVPELEILAAGH